MDGHPVCIDLSSDSNPSRTTFMEHHQPNLDHIVVRVSHQSKSVDFTLNSYLDNSVRASSIRISSHYNYKGIRDFIHDKISLPLTEPLVFNGTQKVCSKHDLELLIISIQMGITTLPLLPELRFPGLILTSEASANSPHSDISLINGTSGNSSSNSTDSHIKRPHPDDSEQPSTKRVKSSNEQEPLNEDPTLTRGALVGDKGSVDSAECAATNDTRPLEDDVDEESYLQQVEDISSRFALRSISAEDWKRVCRMFQCPEDSREYTPVGFKLAISDYQLHAIWWQITQFPIRGVPGGCLGDEMGLGKTIEVLSVFVVFALIKMNYFEVLDYWVKGKMTDGRMHLPRLQQAATAVACPSQQRSPYGVLCPCVKSRDTYKIAWKLPSLPTICFVRPGSLYSWRREYEKLIDFNVPVMKRLTFSIMHNDFKEDKYYHNINRVRTTMASTTKVHVDKYGEPNCSLIGRKGLSSWFLLVSSSGAPALLTAYDGKRVTYSAPKGGHDKQLPGAWGNKVFTINGLAASFVFFDESHTYRGSSSRLTQPFSPLKTITEKARNSPIAFAVSASIPGGGPGQLTSIVDHILRAKRLREGGSPNIGGIASATVLEKMKNDWNYLLQKNHIVSNANTKAEVERRRESMDQLMKNLVPHILMARRNTDTFRGRTIGENDRQIVLEQIKCNMLDGTGRDAFCKLTGNVHAYVVQALEDRHNAWVVGGRLGPEPTQCSIEREFFGGPSAKTAMNLGKACATWTQLLRANVYPMVAQLYLDKLVQEDAMDADNINRYGGEACLSAVSGASRGTVLRKLAASPFWLYRAQLGAQSSRFYTLCKYVEDMVAYRDKQPDMNDPGPADGTNLRHMVVFTDSPVSSFITFMLLYEKYADIQVILINGLTPKLSTKRAPKYGRQEMVDDLMSDCTNDSPNKILVSTYRLCGTGLNMQRANYCILMEPARDAREEAQAAARVNRRGQDMKTITVRLYDDRNLPEVLKRARHRNQGDIVSWQKEGIQWADFV
ncbi:hypothetical protein F4776DRAFT_632419 [Hypoxylon sp. NC0597]|nr:hypothetical protein F4776DRAFT_632419 [Hypoxylon sp. NC0597]